MWRHHEAFQGTSLTNFNCSCFSNFQWESDFFFNYWIGLVLKVSFFLNSGFRMAGDCWRTHETVLSERGRNLCLMLLFCVNNLSVVILMKEIPGILSKYLYKIKYIEKRIEKQVIWPYLKILSYWRTCI